MMLGHSFCFALASAGGCNLGYDVTLGWVWIISETERGLGRERFGVGCWMKCKLRTLFVAC
jgi:hypothetical protein